MPHLHLVGGDDSSRGSTAAGSVVERFEVVVRTRNLGQIELPRDESALGAMIDCNGTKLRIVEHGGSDQPGELPILVVEPV
jgi:hypothetical protein